MTILSNWVQLPVNEDREASNVHTFGTSSTSEVVDNPGSCPIIVKDLEHPGDILIQVCGSSFSLPEVTHSCKSVP